jgi:glycosyltransferase involved in cell wall biosynthesis
LGNLKKKSILIATPFFNEEPGIPNFKFTLEKIILHTKRYNDYEFEYLFIDDGSTDSTFNLLNEIKNIYSKTKVKIHKHKINRGYGACLKTSIKLCNSDYLITYDSDCTYDYKLIFKLIDKININKDDIVNVSYKLAKMTNKITLFRSLLSNGSSLLYKILFKQIRLQNISVLTCSFRIYNYSKIKKIKIFSNDFNSCSEILIRALILGLNISEIPGKINPRKYGFSKMNIYKNILNHLKFIYKIKTGF